MLINSDSQISPGWAVNDLMLREDEPAPEAGVRVLCRHPFRENIRAHVTPSRVEELYKCYWKDGAIRQPIPSLEEVRARVQESLSSLRQDHLRNLNPTPYKVSIIELFVWKIDPDISLFFPSKRFPSAINSIISSTICGSRINRSEIFHDKSGISIIMHSSITIIWQDTKWKFTSNFKPWLLFVSFNQFYDILISIRIFI